MEITFLSFFGIAILGTIPSLLWMYYYLRKDVHREPKSIIIQLFLIGFLLPPFVGFAEVMLQRNVGQLHQDSLLFAFIVLIAAFWEEVTKYLAARAIFHHEREFDELTDAMIYLIIVALGFAASENIIIVLDSLAKNPNQDIFRLLALRGVAPTLLHTLASGMVGYFLARTLFLKESYSLIKGFVSATAIHTLFNLFIMRIDSENVRVDTGDQVFVFLVISLLSIGLAIILNDFYKLKRYDK